MSYDGVATAAAVSELQQNLTLGKIEKIYQPHSEQLIFNIHTKAGRKKLLLSVSGKPGVPAGILHGDAQAPECRSHHTDPAARKRPYYRDPAGNRQ